MENKFCERLKELRQDKGLKQKEFAEIIGVTASAVSGWEVGRNQPSYDVLLHICDYFNVTVDFILGKSDY